MAALGFLRLLKKLAMVVIQDVVLLRQFMPNHYILQHPLFESAEFLRFERGALEAISAARNPGEVRLQTLMPLLMDHINGGFNAIRQDLAVQSSTIRLVDSTVGHLSQAFVDLFQGRLTLNATTTFQASYPTSTELHVNCTSIG